MMSSKAETASDTSIPIAQLRNELDELAAEIEARLDNLSGEEEE